MDLVSYIGKIIKIELFNKFLYEGLVLDADESSLTIKDIKGNRVSISKQSIVFLREVNNAY